MPHRTLQVLYRREEEPWSAFARRLAETETEVIVVLSIAEASLLLKEGQQQILLEQCSALRHRVRLATRQKVLAAEARSQGMRVYDKTTLLRQALAGHAQAEDALRHFAPSVWRQKWRSRLQAAGLLSLPRLRIFILIGLSLVLFLFVVFRLLPSADIVVKPRGDVATQTMNVLFVQSGAVNLPSHVRTLPLIPVDVSLTKSLTFTDISKQFIGTDAEVPMTLTNRGDEPFSLRKGTRLRNQAGMIFRLESMAVVPPRGTLTVRSKADELDTYGEIVGDRGNVPAGVQWTLPGLTADDQKQLLVENRAPATGGHTAYRTVLQKADLDIARRRLEQQLIADAKKQVEDRVGALRLSTARELRLLNNDQLIHPVFTGFVLPLSSLNQPVASVQISGSLRYRVFAYDANQVLDLIRQELEIHLSDDRRILPDTVNLQHLDVRIFDYADDLTWIKGTAELSATEQFVLDPITPTGAEFAKTVRERVAGIPADDALRIIKNMPEVESVSVHFWPPWNKVLPSIPSNISIEAE